MQQLHLIGIVPDRQWIPPAVMDIIMEADILAGSVRLLDVFPDFKGCKKSLSNPLSAWLEELKTHQVEGRKIVVLTSGDPNFYGLAKTLLSVIDPDTVTMIPSPTIVQQAFARLKVSWARAEVVSLHGRDGQSDFWSALYRASHYSGSGHLAVYTDPHNDPMVIAKRLLGRGQHNWRMTVFEELGGPEEKISSWTLFEAKLRKFSPLNLVILECLKPPAPICLGMSEELYVHESGLITKREVRMTTLGLLELQPYHTLWDLGAGSGSVAIEAAALLPHGSIWAVEASPLRSEQIAANRAFFGACQVDIIEDDALAAMNHLPAPDRVFVGGGGRDLAEIIRGAAARLKPHGVLVANTVTLEAFNMATKTIQDLGLDLSVTQIQAARSESLGGSLYMKPQNQVWLVRARCSEGRS